MTPNIHVVEYLHHNHLGYYTSKNSLNPWARRGAVFPTSPTCGYDANSGILCIDQDMVANISDPMGER